MVAAFFGSVPCFVTIFEPGGFCCCSFSLQITVAEDVSKLRGHGARGRVPVESTCQASFSKSGSMVETRREVGMGGFGLDGMTWGAHAGA